MSPRTQEQFKEIREEKMKLILQTAFSLFANKGYHATSISQIAKEAGISKGLLYNYFESKETLLIEILEKGFRELMKPFLIHEQGIKTIEEFEEVIEQSFKEMQNNPEYYKLYFSIYTQPDVLELIGPKLMEMLGPLFKIIEDYYKIRGYSDYQVRAVLLGSVLDGVGFNYIINPEYYPMEPVKKMLIQMLK